MSARGGSRDESRQRLLAEAADDFKKRVAIVTAGTSGRYTKGFAASVVKASWDEIAPQAFAGYAKSASQIDIRREVDGAEVPMLVVVGDLDPVNTAELARETSLQWYRNAMLEIFPQVGHYPMIEAPAATISAVENFIASALNASNA
jgi:pimeloyl-ACP methyl ester carboxylesterase